MKLSEAYTYGIHTVTDSAGGLGRISVRDVYQDIVQELIDRIDDIQQNRVKSPKFNPKRKAPKVIEYVDFGTKQKLKGINAIAIDLWLENNPTAKSAYFIRLPDLDRKKGSLTNEAVGVELIAKNESGNLVPQVYYNLSHTVGLKYSESELTVRFTDAVGEAVYAPMPNKPKIMYTMKKFDTSYGKYSISQDTIWVNYKSSFGMLEYYYATLYHELIHSTATTERVNRELARAVDRQYAIEEGVAQIGAHMLCQKAGIDREIIDDTVSYVSGWLTRFAIMLKQDENVLLYVTSEAQKAVDYITSEGQYSPALSKKIKLLKLKSRSKIAIALAIK